MDSVGETAIILPPGTGDWSVAAERVAGVPLLLRILFSAERAGVHRVIVCAGEAARRLKPLVAQRPALSRLQWIGTSEDELAQALRGNRTSPCFFIRASTALNSRTLRDLKAAFDSRATLVVPARHGPDGPVVLKPPDVRADRQSYPQEVTLSQDAVCLDLTTTPAKTAAEALYRCLGKPTDTWIIRWSRRLLHPVMRRITDTSLTPNHLTLLGFLIGLGAIGCLWRGNYAWTVAGAVLFVVAYLTDLLDGMLARVTFQESGWGEWMDYILDNLVHLGIFAGIVRAVYLDKPEQSVLILGAFVLAGAVASACLAAAHMTQRRKAAERLLALVMHRDFSLIILFAALFDRLEWFLWAAAIGITLFWPYILYTLIHDRETATSIAGESRSPVPHTEPSTRRPELWTGERM